MSYLELDSSLSEEGSILRKEIRKFAQEVLRPASLEIDRMPYDEYSKNLIEDDSPYRKAIRQVKELGYHRIFLPEALGGSDLSPVERHIVHEEIAWGSSGFGVSICADSYPFLFAMIGELLGGGEGLFDEFTDPWLKDKEGKYHGCWAITEPEHGSDACLPKTPYYHDPKDVGALQVSAEKDKDEWNIKGSKYCSP